MNSRLRHNRGPHWLSWRLRVARSTIYAVLSLGLNRLKKRGIEPAVRYEWPYPGDLVLLDIKKLGRIDQGGGKRIHGLGTPHSGLGWKYVHIVIDDHPRLAYAEICPDERSETTVGFTAYALEFFEGTDIRVSRILTDNGAAYRSNVFSRPACVS